MKTAQQIMDEYGLHYLDDGVVDQVIGSMQEYAREACKNQREMCQEAVEWGHMEMISVEEPDLK